MPTENGDSVDVSQETTSAAMNEMQNYSDESVKELSESEYSDINEGSSDGRGQICGTKLPTGTFDPTPYIQRARVTRPAPPKPSCNPMQFVQIKPCNLYQSAQEQLKRAEEVKKVKEIKKEDPEDWQNNLDNWKSSRRKRVEHIIDRVVEVKKLELEEHDRTRRKSKTFSEMLEERTTKGRTNKLASLAVYTEDESNDLSDLGIGTSSASGKSSLSEDYDNNSVLSDNADTEKEETIKPNYKKDHNSNNHNDVESNANNDARREFASSPGYETSSSTAPTSSPDPCEYTYEGAIEDYKSRISKTVASTSKNSFKNQNNKGANTNIYRFNKEATPERASDFQLPRRMSSSKIEDRLMNFETKSATDNGEANKSALIKKDLPKVDILKRRELFEKESSPVGSAGNDGAKERRYSGANSSLDLPNSKSIRERLSSLEKKPSMEEDKTKINRLSGDITSIKNRLQNLEQNNNNNESNHMSDDTKSDSTKQSNNSKFVDAPVPTLKDRLSSLQSAVTKEEIKKPVMLIDEHQLEILKKEDQEKQQALKRNHAKESISAAGTANSIITLGQVTHTDDEQHSNSSHEILSIPDESNIDTDREDSGIHTTDVSCSVSQTDEQAELVNEDNHHHQHSINIDNLHTHIKQEEKINNNINNNSINTESDHNNHQDHHIHHHHHNVSKSNALNSFVVDSSVSKHIQNDDGKAKPTTIECSELSNNDLDISVSEAIEMALKAIDTENPEYVDDQDKLENVDLIKNYQDNPNAQQITNFDSKLNAITTSDETNHTEPIYQNFNDANKVQPQNETQIPIDHNVVYSLPNKKKSAVPVASTEPQHSKEKESVHQFNSAVKMQTTTFISHSSVTEPQLMLDEPYYSVPKPSEPYYEVPKSTKSSLATTTMPVYENIDLFYNQISLQADDGDISGQFNGIFSSHTSNINGIINMNLEPPKEKPPPPPIDNMSDNDADVDDEEMNKNAYNNDYHTYETIDTNSKMKSKVSVQTFDQIDGSHNAVNHKDDCKDDGSGKNKANCINSLNDKPIKRMNSTKRIKKELRNKRSSFLGIEGTNDDDSFLELTVAPPPDMVKLLQEERRLEKQLYMKAGLYDSSDAADSRDSGVSENHSRQSSEPFTNSSEEHEDLLKKKEKEIIEVLEKEEEKQKQNINLNDWKETHDTETETKMQGIEDQIREQEEVLRVERELLQLEQEELKRQRENLMLRENIARQELQHGAKMLMSASRRSLIDINAPIAQTAVPQQSHVLSNGENSSANHYANLPAHQIYQCVETDYRKSMSDLHDLSPSRQAQRNGLSIVTTPNAPAKPIRLNLSIDAGNTKSISNGHISNYIPNGGGLVKIANSPTHPISAPANSQLQHSQSNDDYVPLRNYQINTAHHNGGNMTRNTLLALSATPKPKYTDAWVQQATQQNHNKLATQQALSADRAHEAWLNQQKRKSVPDNFNYNKHWLIQEAEQRRIDQQRGLYRQNYNGVSNATTISTNGWTNSAIQRNGSSDNKPLPDAVIQTITQRVQSKGIGERKRLEAISTESLTSSTNSMINSQIINSPLQNDSQHLLQTQQDKVLSVSGRKKCSHCGEELGRGAAMIIESLRLFYHISCFKCCVCHVQLGDGLNGTDVRVRNQKLHCQNCYSSDDGIKFSCV